MSDTVSPKVRINDTQSPRASAEFPRRPRSANSTSEAKGQWASGRLVTSPTGSSNRARKNSTDESNEPSSWRSPIVVDPISRLSTKRVQNDGVQKQRVSPTVGSPGTGSSADERALQRQLTPEISNRQDSNSTTKEKKKGVSFLSRFSIIGGKRKDPLPEVEDDESEVDDSRPEGTHASVFSSLVGVNGYLPHHKVPPRYIKVRASNKKERKFNRIFLAQELNHTNQTTVNEKAPDLANTANMPAKLARLPKPSGAVWSTEFSKDGRYLAAGGRDQVVRVWAVISTADERQSHEYEDGERLSAPVFRSKPVREFEGHTGDILDLSWSKNNFLLSSSTDKTVRLWHITRQECLCTFRHKDFVTSIAFHPRDDRFFLAGSVDAILRLWSIPDKSVAFWKQLPDLITAVAFTPEGKCAMAGVLSGLCLFYETEGLKYHTQIHVRSSRGKNAKGSKITGIRAISWPPSDPDGEVKVLITSNDSRLRIYNMRDKSLEMKFRGHENACSQINASFSDDGKYVICGSEDRKAYIWSTVTLDQENKDKRPLEYFEAHSEMVTAAVIAPTKTRTLLSASGDPIYELCNPPPVTLLSREETNASSLPPTPGVSSESGKADTASLGIDSGNKKPPESPAYVARCAHSDGHIIITADYLGNIKVFRQDCAYSRRRQDIWESNTSFSKLMLGRSNSIATKGSGGSYSRHDSISQTSLPGQSHGPGNQASDQILSWRNSITSTTSLDNSIRAATLPSRTVRSVSPSKLNKSSFQTNSIASIASIASAARQQPYNNTPLGRTSSTAASSSAPSVSKAPSNIISSQPPSQPPTPGFTFQGFETEEDPSKLGSAETSYGFWNVSSWTNSLISGAKRPALTPDASPAILGKNSTLDMGSGRSQVSKLSSDESSFGSEEEIVACVKCQGMDFRARKLVGKEQKLVCTKCGTIVE